MSEQNVVLITGVSRTGKTAAMGTLEDVGYHRIGDFPVQLLESLGKIINTESDPRYSNIALATTVIDYPKFLQYFENIDINIRVVFLDASNERLLLRYKFIGHHHPMMMFSRVNMLEEAIEVERDVFDALNERTVPRIGTIMMDQHDLRSVLMEELSLDSKPVFSISLVSFDFKRGVPVDVDLVFDVRLLPDPYYIEELRGQASDDTPVYDCTMSFDQAKGFVCHPKSFLDYVFIQYKNGKKNRLIVGIGCTGGHHRSMSVTSWLYSRYKDQYHCYKPHRNKKAG